MSGRKGFTVRGRSVDGGLTNVYICGSDTSYRVRPSGALERSFTLVATLGSVCGYHVQFELLKIIKNHRYLRTENSEFSVCPRRDTLGWVAARYARSLLIGPDDILLQPNGIGLGFDLRSNTSDRRLTGQCALRARI